MIVLELYEPSYEYALKTPTYWLHDLAKSVKARGGFAQAGGRSAFPDRKHSMLVSSDRINWEYRRDYDWGYPPAIIEDITRCTSIITPANTSLPAVPK